MSSFEFDNRVVSGMRPTGKIHLANYHGALKNWTKLQHEYECFFFVADYHALTTGYGDTSRIDEYAFDMVVDWLAAGVSPNSCTIFTQSRVPEHAEFHVILSMITPVSWLERVPTYKDMMNRLNDRDLNTYGFLGYPVLQSSDILMYRAGKVPVGADQESHVELCREIARRFNHLFGKQTKFDTKVEEALGRIDKKASRRLDKARREYAENGDMDSLERARALLLEQQQLSINDRERLFGYLEGGGRIILPEPQTLLTETPVVTGLDGEKMSKSYNNTISLREEPKELEQKIRTMQTDPARVRRTDPGDPAKCPVYSLHKLYLEQDQLDWAANGCKSASIGCVECKGPLIEAISNEQKQFHERARPFLEEPHLVRNILTEGSENARAEAKETLEDVKAAVGISYR